MCLARMHNGLCQRSMCAGHVTVSTDSKFCPVSNFTWLHTLTLASCFYALLSTLMLSVKWKRGCLLDYWNSLNYHVSENFLRGKILEFLRILLGLRNITPQKSRELLSVALSVKAVHLYFVAQLWILPVSWAHSSHTSPLSTLPTLK